MTLVLLVLLLLVAWVLHRRGRRLAGHALVAFTALLFLAVACGPLPRWMLDNLQHGYPARVSGPWASRNAIELLGAGTTRITPDAPLQPSLFAWGRIARAAMLYRDCKMSGQQCLLLVSGGDSQHHGRPEAVVYAEVLLRLGVAPADLQWEPHSMNTWQNAQFSRPLLRAFDPQKLLLVSSGIHLRRSLLYFEHFGLRPQPVRGGDVEAVLSPWPLAWNMVLCDAALHEYLGIARFRVYNALGWNAPAVRSPLIPAGR